jgi:hypothetical protein
VPLPVAARFPAAERPFADLAAWLHHHTAPEDVVWGYPNHALAFALAGRVRNGPLPNFLGDETDLDAMVAAVRGPDPPRWVVVSPTLYPYPADFPYFPDPAPLVAALEGRYARAAEIATPPAGGRPVGAIVVYRAP